MKSLYSRAGFFWLFIVVIGTCEASFAYNGFDSGPMRWLLLAMSVLNVGLFAHLDQTPLLRKMAVYVGAALVWGAIRYGYQWVHLALGNGDLALFSVLVWADLLLNLATATILIRTIRLKRP